MVSSASSIEPTVLTEYPSVTVVVTTKNNRETIWQSVSSITRLNYPRSKLSIIVLDASDDESTKDALGGLSIQYIRFDGNAPSAYNYALAKIRTDLVGFVDGDAVVEQDWLLNMISTITDSKVAGAAGPIQTWNPNSIIPRCIGYDLESRLQNPNKIVRTSTTNLVLRRSVLEEVGGFDESLEMAYDADFGYRLSNLGKEIKFAPTAIVYHHHRSTLRAYLKQQYVYARSDIGLYRKNLGLIMNDNVTKKWMIMQPPLLLLLVGLSAGSILLPIIGLVIPKAIVTVGTASSIMIGAILLALYIVNSSRLAIRAKDPVAFPVLLCLFATRAVVWTAGGIIGVIMRARLRN
jgi:cellulose synthase/poly-beta-1,6-N-acetylglucosamine synthase-like glycosyltransferase